MRVAAAAKGIAQTFGQNVATKTIIQFESHPFTLLVYTILFCGAGEQFERAVAKLEESLPFGGRKYGQFFYTGVNNLQYADGSVQVDQGH